MFYIIFGITLALFLTISVLSVKSIFSDNEKYLSAAKYMFPPAVLFYILLGAARVYHSQDSGFADITSSLWGFFYIFDLIMIVIIFYLYYSKWRKEWKSFIVFVMPFITIILVISIPFIESARKVSLTSDSSVIINHILAAHIFFTIIGELFFFLSFMGSILYITMERQLRKKTSMKFIFKLPALDSVEKFNRWSISRSFYFLTTGIVIGLVMSFLVYDTVFLGTPKEVHIFFSWAVILGIYFIRRMKKLVSHKINIINIVMFIIIMFLFIFTNIYITKGFHGFK